jgi:hypothetical protein
MCKVLKLSKWRPGLVHRWFLEQSVSTVRTRLKGVAVFGEWCMKKNLSVEEIANQLHPEVWLEECLQWIFDVGGSYTSADLCRTAVSALFRDWFDIKEVGSNSFVSRTLMSKAETRTPMGRKRKIWDLSLLMNGFEKELGGRTVADLQWSELIGRMGAMLVSFTCCRIVEMFRIVFAKSVWRTDENTMLLASKSKTSGGRLKYRVLMHTANERMDPVNTVLEYRRRTENFANGESAFFFYEDGKCIETVEKLSARYLTPYIRAAGIPPPLPILLHKISGHHPIVQWQSV